MPSRVVQVAVPLPVQTMFAYRVPEGMRLPERGVRVVVPFASRRAVALATGPAPDGEARALKDVVEVLDEEPLSTPALLDLAAWTADHYLAPPGECYRLILPPAGIRASRSIARL